MALRKEPNLGVVPSSCELGVARVKRRLEGFGQRQVAGVVAGELVAQLPDAVRNGRQLVTGDGQGQVVTWGSFGNVRVEFPAQGETTRNREHLDIEEVWGVHFAGQRVEKVGISVASDQSLDHRGGIDHDYRRPAWTAATMSPDDGPVLRSRALSRSMICAFVGRAAILASSAAT